MMHGNTEMVLKGDRIEIRDLIFRDVLEFKEWGVHDNTLLSDYNLSLLSDTELRFWYSVKRRTKYRRYFSVRNEEGRLIGYLGLKNIQSIKRIAYLGIVFDANYTNRGYGTESLNLFLNYYFNILKMKEIKLQVNQFNKRAIRCYEKVGFRIYSEYSEEFELQHVECDNRYFEKINGIVYSLNYTMSLKKRDYKG